MIGFCSPYSCSARLLIRQNLLIFFVLPESKDEAKSSKEIAQDMELKMGYVDPPTAPHIFVIKEGEA